MDNQKIIFDRSLFYEELPSYFEKAEGPDLFRLTEAFSIVYHRFLERDLSGYRAIREQMISPISLGLKVVDQDQKPIIYHDEGKRRYQALYYGTGEFEEGTLGDD